METNKEIDELPAPASREGVKAYMLVTYHLTPVQVDELVEGAVINLATNLKSADDALAAHDMPLFVRHVHTAKGALLNMGLNALAMLAKKIEFGGRNNEPLDFPSLLQELRNGLILLLPGS